MTTRHDDIATAAEWASSPRDRSRGAEPPGRPPAWQELVAGWLFRALAPRLGDGRQPRVPRRLEPFEPLAIERRQGCGRADRGRLAATWYPAGNPRGAVLLAPPWHRLGQAWLHRSGRIEALRRAGYHVLTFDPGGVGASGPPPAGFYDRDLEDALAALRERAGGLPLHFWGVSFGGYWAHPVLSRLGGVSGAVFEDVSPHLIEWSKRMAPLGYPNYLVFQHALSQAYRYLDLRRHAPHLRVGAAAYVSGGRDRGVRPEETRELARLAGAECLLVPGADHLEAIRRDGERLIALALETFARADSPRAVREFGRLRPRRRGFLGR